MKLNQKGFNDVVVMTIIAGIIGALFITGVFVWQEIERGNALYVIKGKISKIIEVREEPKERNIVVEDACDSLTQEECYESNECKGIFGSSFCNDHLCTMDWAYLGCMAMREGEYEQAIADMEICESTNGDWNNPDDKYLGSCNCGWVGDGEDRVMYYFFEEEGCITLADACTLVGGEFYNPGELLCENVDGYLAGCSKADNEDDFPLYNRLDACMCANNMIMTTGGGSGAFCGYNYKN